MREGGREGGKEGRGVGGGEGRGEEEKASREKLMDLNLRRTMCISKQPDL